MKKMLIRNTGPISPCPIWPPFVNTVNLYETLSSLMLYVAASYYVIL